MNIAENKDKIMTGLYIGATLLILFIVYKILSAVGLIKTRAKKQAEAEIKTNVETIRSTKYFDPLFSDSQVFKHLGDNVALQYAKDLRSSVRGAGTNEELIFATFAKFNNKANISEVAAAYYKYYKRDLRADLLDDLSESDMNTLWKLILKLPNF